MTAPVVVGYTATDAGSDALALGARLARATGGDLHIVLVLPAESRSVITPPAAGYEAHVRGQAEAWLAEAGERVAEVQPRSHVRYAESYAEGLVAMAGELGARCIVVGAANGGMLGRHRLGSVASELLHSSDVPVALAPAGSKDRRDAALTRVTAAIGTRAGADALMEESAALAGDAVVPLRLVSLETIDLPPGLDTGTIRLAGNTHAENVLARARKALPAGIRSNALVAQGASVEEAVGAIEWDPAEIAVVGSSRLAQPRRLFLGSTAAKMLHVLPVPLLVVPRTRSAERSAERARS